jgi:hypothetical protein
MSKVMAALGIVVGGLGAIIGLLEAAGVNVSEELELSIAKVCALVLLVLGVFFHPSTPVGPKS